MGRKGGKTRSDVQVRKWPLLLTLPVRSGRNKHWSDGFAESLFYLRQGGGETIKRL